MGAAVKLRPRARDWLVAGCLIALASCVYSGARLIARRFGVFLP